MMILHYLLERKLDYIIDGSIIRKYTNDMYIRKLFELDSPFIRKSLYVFLNQVLVSNKAFLDDLEGTPDFVKRAVGFIFRGESNSIVIGEAMEMLLNSFKSNKHDGFLVYTK